MWGVIELGRSGREKKSLETIQEKTSFTKAEEQRVQTNGRFLEKEFLFRGGNEYHAQREKKNEKTEFIERQRDEESG